MFLNVYLLLFLAYFNKSLQMLDLIISANLEQDVE